MRIHLDPPALIVVTTTGLKDYGGGTFQAGASRGPLVIIRPGYEADAGLLAHELLHVWHWWMYGALATALIALSGYLAGSVEIAGTVFPLWSLAPAGIAANPLAYVLWPEWREAEEIAAYRVQATYYPIEQQPAKLAKFARFIATRYGLDISEEEALEALRC